MHAVILFLFVFAHNVAVLYLTGIQECIWDGGEGQASWLQFTFSHFHSSTVAAAACI